MSYSENFANNLRKLRARLDITQCELADLLGYSEKTVSKWECGASIPSIDTLFELAAALGTTVEGLFRADERYYLAIDGGGTKTALLLADGEGKVIRSHRAYACNPVDVGIERACEVLREAIAAACDGIPYSQITLFAGIAGGTSAGMRERLFEFFDTFGFSAFENDSDSRNIIAAGIGDADGIAMILGTGVCAFTQISGERSRVAGWGYLIDDGGSGYNLGRDALSAYFRSVDGRSAPSPLTEEVEAIAEGDATAIMTRIYGEGKRAVASFAPAVFAAAERRDALAISILERNMREAAEIAEAARARFPKHGRVPLVLAGGLTSHRIALELFREALTDSDAFEISVLDREPVYGALKMAMSLKKGDTSNA